MLNSFHPGVSRYTLCRIAIGLWVGLFGALSVYARDNFAAQLQHTDQLKLQRPDSAYILLRSILAKAEEEKNTLAQAQALQQMGYIFYHHSSYPQALNHYLQADKLFRNTNRKDLQADNLNDIGTVYYSNRQGNLSLQYFHEALNIYTSLNDSDGEAKTYGMIGHIYEKTGRYDSATYFQRLALHYYIILNDQRGMADIYENIASIFEDLEVFDSSFIYYNKALALYEQDGDLISQISLRNNLGDIYRKTGRYRQGLAQTRMALQLAQQTNELFQENSAYYDMAKAYNLMGNNDSAYYYLAISRKQLHDIYSQENSQQMAFLQAIFDIERKNNEIQKLENARKTESILWVSAIILFVLLLSLGSLIVNRQRLKIDAERKINEQEKKVYEANNALMQTELQNRQLQEDNLKHELSARFQELTSHTLHVIQKNQLIDDLKSKLEDLIKDDKRDHKKQIRQILQQIDHNYNQDKHWEELRIIFEQVHQSFYDNLKKYADDLTASELRLATLLKINLNSADMATLLGISQDSLRIARYRLRKKLKLEQGASLTTLIQNL